MLVSLVFVRCCIQISRTKGTKTIQSVKETLLCTSNLPIGYAKQCTFYSCPTILVGETFVLFRSFSERKAIGSILKTSECRAPRARQTVSFDI